MIFRRFCVWLSNTTIYSYVLLKILPFVRFTTKLTITRGNQYWDAYKLLKPADIIVTKDSSKMTTILIGGDWSHSALFLGKLDDFNKYEVAEMTHHNYTKSDFFDIVKESSDFAIYRCKDFDEEYSSRVVQYARNNFENVSYDIGFELGIRALYCSELIYQADYEKRLKVSLADLRSLGRQYISPTGLSKAYNVELIYDSRKTKPRY